MTESEIKALVSAAVQESFAEGLSQAFNECRDYYDETMSSVMGDLDEQLSQLQEIRNPTTPPTKGELELRIASLEEEYRLQDVRFAQRALKEEVEKLLSQRGIKSSLATEVITSRYKKGVGELQDIVNDFAATPVAKSIIKG